MFGCAEEEEDSAPPDVSGTAPIASEFVGGNNTATIEGDLIGKRVEANTDLYKSITIILKNSSPYFSLGPARISRADSTSDFSVKLVLPVKNNTENLAFCNIETVGISLNNGMGQWIISTISNNKVLGSLGIEDSKYAASCLGAGETGYILQSITAVDGSILTLYDDVSQIEIGEMVYTSSSVIDPNISIVPQYYDVTEDGISVIVKNTNQDYGYIWPSRSYAILLDYDGTITETTTDATDDTDEYVIVDQTTDIITYITTDASTDATADATADVTTYTTERPGYTPGIPFYYFVIGGSYTLPYQLRPGEDATMDSGVIEFNGSSYKAIIILGLGTDAWSSAYKIVNEK